jgi:hypothetical protein
MNLSNACMNDLLYEAAPAEYCKSLMYLHVTFSSLQSSANELINCLHERFSVLDRTCRTPYIPNVAGGSKKQF